MVLSAEARKYKADVAKIVTAGPIIGPVMLKLAFYRPRKSGDLDGRLKVLLDALQGVLYLDDKQVEEIHAYRFDDKKNPRAEVECLALDSPP
jgi:Holliday junction resolvase RusA-like endonuclease